VAAEHWIVTCTDFKEQIDRRVWDNRRIRIDKIVCEK
jgi:hypothetical protein